MPTSSRRQPLGKLKDWAGALKRDVVALWIASGDKRTPIAARALALLVAGYALSPIDLIPDFIPVLGLLDDVILLPLGIWLVLRMIPPALMAEFRVQADQVKVRPRVLAGAALVIVVWLAVLAWIAAALWRAD